MEEFECTICMRILFKPVSISCGHTFCRNCLVKSLQTQIQCPQCREPCLTSINRLPVNIMIQNYIEKNYQEQLKERIKEDEEDENQNLKYRPEKFQFGQQLPLFALQDFLSGPSEVVKFNIFEPRYIEMIERISSGDKMFAICDIKTQFTVAAVLKHVQRRHNPHYQYIYEITTIICCPLKINQILNAQMEPIEFQNKQIRENIILEKYQLYQVVFERIKDEDEIDQEMKDLQNEIKNFVNSHIQNISESEKQFLMLHYDQSQLQSLQEFSWHLISLLQLPKEQKISLLQECRSSKTRLKAIKQFIHGKNPGSLTVLEMQRKSGGFKTSLYIFLGLMLILWIANYLKK